MIEYATSLELRIDWSDLDSFGHINNLAILRYAQSARLNYMEQVGMMKFHEETGIGPVLASMNCQFRKQLFYPGKVTIRSLIDHLKTTSFQMRHVVLDGQGDCVAETTDVLVMFDYRRNEKQPIPEAFRRRLETFRTADMPS